QLREHCNDRPGRTECHASRGWTGPQRALSKRSAADDGDLESPHPGGEPAANKRPVAGTIRRSGILAGAAPFVLGAARYVQRRHTEWGAPGTRDIWSGGSHGTSIMAHATTLAAASKQHARRD